MVDKLINEVKGAKLNLSACLVLQDGTEVFLSIEPDDFVTSTNLTTKCVNDPDFSFDEWISDLRAIVLKGKF